jgi:hypothetical protein
MSRLAFLPFMLLIWLHIPQPRRQTVRARRPPRPLRAQGGARPSLQQRTGPALPAAHPCRPAGGPPCAAAGRRARRRRRPLAMPGPEPAVPAGHAQTQQGASRPLMPPQAAAPGRRPQPPSTRRVVAARAPPSPVSPEQTGGRRPIVQVAGRARRVCLAWRALRVCLASFPAPGTLGLIVQVTIQGGAAACARRGQGWGARDAGQRGRQGTGEERRKEQLLAAGRHPVSRRGWRDTRNRGGGGGTGAAGG